MLDALQPKAFDVVLSPSDASAGAVLTIDLDAVCANYAWLAGRVAPAACGAVVKADAYGLGAERLAPALAEAGCRDFFVAHLAEGLVLKPLLPEAATIMILNGLQPGAEATCAEAGLVPVLNSLDQVEAWATLCTARANRLPAALQLDSGMSRLGLAPSELEALTSRPDLLRAFDLCLVMSHLACADEPNHPLNAAQRELFGRLAARLPKTRLSLANSGGVLLDRAFHGDLARPGVALYGVNPDPRRDTGLQPVARLDARVIQVRTVPAGAAVGYGATVVADRPLSLATLAIGYADGWSRHLSHRGAAFFGETRLPIVGRVSMDSTSINVSALPEGTLRLGSLVELIGPHQTLDDIAALCGTIPYEILTSLGRRFERRTLDRAAGSSPQAGADAS